MPKNSPPSHLRLCLFQILDPPLTSTVQTNMATAKHTWLYMITQSTVQPVPTRHRRHACIEMRTALSGNTGLDPMLFQYWSRAVGGGGGAILKQHWVKSSCLLGSTQVSVYTLPSIIFSPADQGSLLLARQPANHKLTTILEIERGGHNYDVTHLQILTCEVACSVYGGQCRLWLSSL